MKTRLLQLIIMLSLGLLCSMSYAQKHNTTYDNRDGIVSGGMNTPQLGSTELLIFPEYEEDPFSGSWNTILSDKRSMSNTLSVSDNFVVEKIVRLKTASSDNALFKFAINVSSGETVPTNKDRYTSTYTFTKKNDLNRRLTNFKAYIDLPYFNYNYWGGAKQGEAYYEWDEDILRWKMPNPFTDQSGKEYDTSLSSEDLPHIKFYFTEITPGAVAYLPKKELTGNTEDVGSRPAILFQNFETTEFNTPINSQFYLFQEKLRETNGNPGAWYGWNFSNILLFSYEFDASISATNPTSQSDIIPGANLTFTSDIAINASESFKADVVWQVSYNNGETYTDIAGSESDTEGLQTISKSLSFVPELWEENALYRLKISPQGAIENNIIYTEPATFTFLEHTLTFDSKDGSYVPPQRVLHGSLAQEPFDPPTKEGSFFGGWLYGDIASNNIWDFGTMPVERDETLFALWKQIYTVLFLDHDDTVLKTDLVPHGDAATPPKEPSRVGYTFDGWDKDFSVITEDLSVTAQYDIVSSIAENEQDEALTIEYNPISGILHVYSTKTLTDISLYHINGSLARQTLNSEGGIYVGSLQSGIYLVKASTTQGTSVKRFIKK